MSKLIVLNDNYERPDLCGPCGGACCKNLPGCAFPSDFGNTESEIRETLRERLKSGNWSIDWWEGDPRDVVPKGNRLGVAYFLRPATVQSKGRLKDPAWHGACVFHSANGCTIPETRPMGCRGLEPMPDMACEDRYGSKKDAAIAWIPYTKLIEEIYEELSD